MSSAETAPESQSAPIVPVLWCTVNILGTQFPVWISDDKNHPDLLDCEGRCLYGTCTILIAHYLQDTRKRDILTHEIMHAVIYMCGAGVMFEKLFGKSNIDWEDREEILISTFGVNLHDTLIRNGFLTYPEIPESVRVPSQV
jgi:hypothetical protein